MHRTVHLLPSIALVVACCAMPNRASAYCVLPERPNYPQGPFAQFKTVPVWMSRNTLQNADTSLGYIGLGEAGLPPGSDVEAETEWVKAAIDIINSAATNAPRLYFAGYYPAAPWGGFPGDQPVGILISTFGDCDQEAPFIGMALANEDHVDGGTRARLGFRRGGQFTCPPNTPNELIWYANPDEDQGDALDDDSAFDFVGVLVHEMLHALGLGHTKNALTSGECDVDNFDVANSSASVMAEGETAARLFRRRLKHDDIMGLRAIYDAPERTVSFAESGSPTPATWTWVNRPPIQPGVLTVNTPVSLSNAARVSDDIMWAVFTDESDEVRFLQNNWFTGWLMNTPGGTAVRDFQGNTVQSWDRAIVARGAPQNTSSLFNSRELVAWIGGPDPFCCDEEDPDNLDVRVHFRIRRQGVWLTPVNPQSAGPTKYRSLGAGYDPRSDRFVLAYIDTCDVDIVANSCRRTPDVPAKQQLFVRTINAATGGGGCTQALVTAGHVFAVGDVSCDLRTGGVATRCIIPVATTDTEGPKVRLIEGDITEHDGSVCFVRHPNPEPPLTLPLAAYGAPSSAMNGGVNLGPIIVGHVPSFPNNQPSPQNYVRMFTMDRPGLLDGNIDNARTFRTWFWPLQVGTATNLGAVQWRVITY